MSMQQLDRLDALTDRLRDGGEDGFWPLSTGERLYVALAANRVDLLEACDYTVAGAHRGGVGRGAGEAVGVSMNCKSRRLNSYSNNCEDILVPCLMGPIVTPYWHGFR
jgi:hypothetical protein